MADYFRFHHAWLKQAERLSESERGRLLAGIAEFSVTGVVPEFRGNERYLFPHLSPAPDAPSGAESPPKPRAAKPFVQPTVEEITAYCKERGNTVEPQRFFDFYESKGWRIGKDPMKDWKASVRTWEQNRKEQKQAKSSNPYKAALEKALRGE